MKECSGPADHPIPGDWLEPVLRILDTNDLKRILVVDRVRRDWEALFPRAFLADLFDAFHDALCVPGVTGLHITDQPEPGTTYAFWFHHDKHKLYGKICLKPDRLLIKVLSAHIPLKGDHLSG